MKSLGTAKVGTGSTEPAASAVPRPAHRRSGEGFTITELAVLSALCGSVTFVVGFLAGYAAMQC